MINPEIIAEIGVNYYDIAAKLKISLVDAAKKMVYEGREVGIKTVKFQVYEADRLAADDSPAYWDLNEEPTTSQKELFSHFDKLTESDYKEIAKYCKTIGVEFMSTPFDLQKAKFINPLVLRHKVASADITNFPLLKEIASFGKPVILSTGASKSEDVAEAVEFLRSNGCKDITLLHCILSYPTVLGDVNLWKMQALKEHFPDCRIGISDHAKFSLDVLISAWFLGAEVIEKHFTLDKALKGNDHYHAGDVQDFKQLFRKIQLVKKIYGEKTNNWLFECEQAAARNARRGSYLNRNVKKGNRLTYEHFSFLRPQFDGVSPKEVMNYVKDEAIYATDMEKGTLLIKSHIINIFKVKK